MSETSSPRLALYYFDACPFCQMVLHAADAMKVDVELRNILQDRTHQSDLVAARGRATVPVLRIQDADRDEWLPESRDIVRYLESLAA